VYSLSSGIAAAAAAFAYRFSRAVARQSLPSEREENWRSVSRFLETRVSLAAARRSIVACSTGRVNFVPRKRRSASRRSARGNSELR